VVEGLALIPEETLVQYNGGSRIDDRDGLCSGYESSGSSVYAVDSDEEDYDVGANR
jgi:hypothetical protein